MPAPDTKDVHLSMLELNSVAISIDHVRYKEIDSTFKSQQISIHGLFDQAYLSNGGLLFYSSVITQLQLWWLMICYFVLSYLTAVMGACAVLVNFWTTNHKTAVLL